MIAGQKLKTGSNIFKPAIGDLLQSIPNYCGFNFLEGL
jgi:hypothetical protein